MPFRSEKQRRWMWANDPEMAQRWSDKYGSKIHPKKQSKKSKKRKNKRKKPMEYFKKRSG